MDDELQTPAIPAVNPHQPAKVHLLHQKQLLAAEVGTKIHQISPEPRVYGAFLLFWCILAGEWLEMTRSGHVTCIIAVTEVQATVGVA